MERPSGYRTYTRTVLFKLAGMLSFVLGFAYAAAVSLQMEKGDDTALDALLVNWPIALLLALVLASTAIAASRRGDTKWWGAFGLGAAGAAVLFVVIGLIGIGGPSALSLWFLLMGAVLFIPWPLVPVAADGGAEPETETHDG